MPPAPVASLSDPKVASHLLDPVRGRILGLAREPTSASQIAEKLGQSRQRVNYHVRILAEAGLLKEAGRRERRNLTEVLYQTNAAGYVVDPEALGPLAPDAERVDERGDADHLLALASRTVHEVGRTRAEGGSFALDTELRFASPAEREAFLRGLQEAINTLAARHATGRGRSHRLVVLAHPRPQK